MVSNNKNETSWFWRILGRNNDLDDDFEEIAADESLGEVEEGDFEDGDVFEIEEDEDISTPVRSSGDEDLQINLIDKGDTLVAQALVPGVSESDINIDLNREMLTVTTGSNLHCVEKDGDYLYEEITFGSFSRSLLLPSEIEVDDAKAEVKDGILTIDMPKIDKAAHKKLSVRKK